MPEPDVRDAAEFQLNLVGAMMRFTKETGVPLQKAAFELHVHPDQVAQWRRTAGELFPLAEMALNGMEILGFKLVEDATVDTGHPVLRSSWSMTL